VTDQPRQQAPGGGSGPATDPMTPVPDAAGDRAGRWALALGSAAVLLMIVFPPAAPVPAAAALVVGIRARRRARRAAHPAGRGTLAGVVMGSIGLAISIPLGTTQILLWGELHRYISCREAANTITDQQACRDTFMREVERRLNLRAGSLKHYNIPM
jgi:hypothetical protein